MNAELLNILASPLDPEGPPLRLAAWKFAAGDNAGDESEGKSGGAPAPGPFVLDGAEPVPADLAGLEIVEGALAEPETGRWFAIAEGVPHLVRDPLRHRKLETPILQRLKALPKELREGLSPILQLREFAPESPGDVSKADADTLDEDRYWGGFFQLHWDAGDRSIFDMDAKATHPTFWPAGVREPDARDLERRWGVWPDHLGRWLFDDLAKWAKREREQADASEETPWGWDAGCGGGQFGLAASRMGMRMVGSDIATQALACGRLQALATGAPIDYVRAESSLPPFRPGTFRLLMCKDALHHEPDPAAALAKWLKAARPACRALVYEHAGDNKLARRLREALAKRLVPRIQKRFSVDPEISPFFQTESANEDIGRDALKAALKASFPRHKIKEEVRLYHDADALCWYAFGRLRRPARWLAGALRLGDPLLKALGGPEYLAFHGWRDDPEAD